MFFQEQSSHISQNNQVESAQNSFVQKQPHKKKPSFIDQMRKRLNMYNLEKIKLVQNKKIQQSWYHKQTKAKDDLIEIDQFTIIQPQVKSKQIQKVEKFDELSGWNHDILKNRNKGKTQTLQKQKDKNNRDSQLIEKAQAFTQSIQFINSKFSDNTAFHRNLRKQIQQQTNRARFCEQRNSNMIIYLKSLLNRLQSPTGSKDIRSQPRERIHSQNKNSKFKTQQTVAKIKKSKLSLHKIHPQQSQYIKDKQFAIQTLVPHVEPGVKASQSGSSNNQNRIMTFRQKDKKERPKFQAMDSISRKNESENRPFTIHNHAGQKDYQKIKRKMTANQNQIDIAHEKDILQQLIRGTSHQKNNLTGNYYSQKTSKHQKFTLKNLLC